MLKRLQAAGVRTTPQSPRNRQRQKKAPSNQEAAGEGKSPQRRTSGVRVPHRSLPELGRGAEEQPRLPPRSARTAGPGGTLRSQAFNFSSSELPRAASSYETLLPTRVCPQPFTKRTAQRLQSLKNSEKRWQGTPPAPGHRYRAALRGGTPGTPRHADPGAAEGQRPRHRRPVLPPASSGFPTQARQPDTGNRFTPALFPTASPRSPPSDHPPIRPPATTFPRGCGAPRARPGGNFIYF